MAQIKCNYCGTINSNKDFYCKNDDCGKNLNTETHKVVKPKKTTSVKVKELQSVKVVDFEMGFGSMVMFMVKWVIASIPAMIILGLIVMVLVGVFGLSLSGLK